MHFLRNALGEIDYPTTDGEPMGETDLHRDMMIDLIEALRHFYSQDPQVYVSGNILLYYEEGNPLVHLSPDVLVTLGVEKKRRESYKLWEIGRAPDVVIEVTSRSTKMRDVGVKKGLYEAMKVREYILFDPRNEYLMPRFQVFRLESGVYIPCLVPESVGYASLLGLTFRVVDEILRIFETDTGRILPTPAELTAKVVEERKKAQQAQVEAQQAQVEAQQAQAEAQQAQLEAQQAQLEAQQAQQLAEQERQRSQKLVQRLRDLGFDPEPL